MFTTKHMFSDLFDVRNNFDVTMIAVFTAIDDWYSWAKLKPDAKYLLKKQYSK